MKRDHRDGDMKLMFLLLTLKQVGHFLVNECERISLCWIEMQSFILGIRNAKGRSSIAL